MEPRARPPPRTSFRLCKKPLGNRRGDPVTPQGLWARPPGPWAEGRAGVVLAAMAGLAMKVVVEAEVHSWGVWAGLGRVQVLKGWGQLSRAWDGILKKIKSTCHLCWFPEDVMTDHHEPTITSDVHLSCF